MKISYTLTCIFMLFAITSCDDPKPGESSDMGANDTATKNKDIHDDVKTTTDMGGKTDVDVDMKAQKGVRIPGLSDEVKVSFDSKGVLHLSCQSDEDCMAAQGYYHAANRFLQMDIQRRVATGRVSGLVGDLALGFDTSSRLIFSTREGEPLGDAIWTSLKPETKKLFEAYTKGVNAWLKDLQNERNGAQLSEEYAHALLSPDEIEPWKVTDSVAGTLLLLEQLSNSSGSDLSRGRAFAALNDADTFKDLFSTMSATKVATMPASGETYKNNSVRSERFPNQDFSALLESMKNNKNLMENADAKIHAFETFLNRKEFETGSNNWVVGPALTDTGNAMLANDPHLGLTNPALWYLVEIDSKTSGKGDFHIAGVSLPGLPGIVLGHNEKISWGGTVMFYDLADVYIETLSPDKKGVMFKGKKVAFTEVKVDFDIARDQTQTRTLRYVPHHGPVVAIDEAAGTAVSIRWTGNDGRSDIDMFFDLMRANDVEEARTALLQSVSTNQNWIVADTKGDIAWFPYSGVPKRPWASEATPPWLPLDGSSGNFEWDGVVDYKDLPQMKNPKNKFIATANADPTGTFEDGNPTSRGYYLTSYGEFAGLREQAVVDHLKNLKAGEYNAAKGKEMQGSTFLVLKDWVLPHLKAVYDPAKVNADSKAVYEALSAWEGTCPTGLGTSAKDGPINPDPKVSAESIGCSAFHFYLLALQDLVFADDFEPTGFSTASLYATRSLVILLNEPIRLENSELYYENSKTTNTIETKADMLLGALQVAADNLKRDFGSSTPNDWRWGKVHTISLRVNVLSNANLTQFNESFAAPGGLFSINVANPSLRKNAIWSFESGPSMRHHSEMNPAGVESFWTLPGGQTHRRDSDLYLSLLEDWLDVKHFKMPFSKADVDAAAMTRVSILPE